MRKMVTSSDLVGKGWNSFIPVQTCLARSSFLGVLGRDEGWTGWDEKQRLIGWGEK